MTSDDDSDAFLLSCAAGAGADPCPDPGLVAGFAEGTLLEAEADRVAAHAASCATCRAAIADLAGVKAAATAPRGSAPILGLRVSWIAAAAAVFVLAFGAILFARSLRDDTPSDTDARLVAAARDLAAAEPAVFGGFAPLSPAERAAIAGTRERGGLRLLGPTGVVLSPRPTFRWIAVPGAAKYEVSLKQGDQEVWKGTATGTELLFPADRAFLAGSYTWSVATDGVLGGRTEGRRTFRVGVPEESEAFTAAALTVAARTPADLRDLVLAHWAIRRQLIEDAEPLAREAVARDPKNAVARETLRAVLRILGSPEGDAPERPR